MKVNWYLGTMGFSYEDWNGTFYPDGLDSRQYLAHYSQIFNAVEIDSTFYGIPRSAYVRRWAEMPPERFKFCPKTPKTITHELRLDLNEMGIFLDTMRLLGDKLGVILIQFPPSFTAAQTTDLEEFLGQLPADLRYAVEFRHRSWYTDDTIALLRKIQVCWVATEYADLPETLQPTTDFIYIRWIGRHGRFEHHDRQVLDPEWRLRSWWDRIQAELTGNIYTVYGFFNNDYAGHSPTTCNAFKEIVGLPVTPIRPPRQGRLF